MTLQDALIWILSGGGAGQIAYWLMEAVPFLANLTAVWKRYVSLALAALLAVAAFGIGVVFTYLPTPASGREWVEAIFSVIALALGWSQAVHGMTRLAKSSQAPSG